MHNMCFSVIYPYNGVIVRHDIPLIDFKVFYCWIDYGYLYSKYQPSNYMGYADENYSVRPHQCLIFNPA
jgi:hypothetical protein